MAPRKQRTPDAAEATGTDTVTVSTEANADPTTEFNPAALDAPDDELAAQAQYQGKHVKDLQQRDMTKYADPSGKHGVQFPDGYKIQLQESKSRNTVEFQFGNGTKEDQPKAFDEIKAVLKEAGYRWNGTNAWAKELKPVVGSQNDRLRARDENRRIRAIAEDELFPKIIVAEEAHRGEIDLSEQTRERINRASEGPVR